MYFGTPEENNYSVITAILRNPDVYFQRLKAVVRAFPTILNDAYGIKYTIVLLLLAVRGVIALIKRKEAKLLLVMLLWVAPLAMGFINTIIRPGYIRFPYFILYTLAGIGLQALVVNLNKRWEIIGWLLATLLVGGVALATWKTAIFYGIFIFLLGILIAWYLYRQYPAGDKLAPILLLVFLCAGSDFTWELPRSEKVATWGQWRRSGLGIYVGITSEGCTRISRYACGGLDGTPGVRGLEFGRHTHICR